ncbi:MAG TPA: SprT family zinc-dependent metalloprotease [Candidatus Saccharimonadales bacterium]
MPSFHDNEFGEVTVRRSAKARSVKLSVAPNGTLRVSMPPYAPIFLAKRLITSSRDSIRNLLTPLEDSAFYHGMQIGKSHSIHVTHGAKITAKLSGQVIETTAPDSDVSSKSAQSIIKDVVIKALRKEAKSYLPKRLAFLAEKHDFHYEQVRFSHASSRWGSCSSQGTISLNIALMTLPFELIDYVLIHELCHTIEMNHSQRFWKLVAQIVPDFKAHRQTLKKYSPTIS